MYIIWLVCIKLKSRESKQLCSKVICFALLLLYPITTHVFMVMCSAFSLESFAIQTPSIMAVRSDTPACLVRDRTVVNHLIGRGQICSDEALGAWRRLWLRDSLGAGKFRI